MHATRLLRRPSYAKLAVAWPKTVKTHNLQRLIWAAKNSRGANFFHLSPFPRYTSFTVSQLRKIGRCLAKNSENTQIATFNFGCKKFARRKIFSFQPFCTLHVFYGVPATQKWPLPGQKQSKHTICHVYFGLQKTLVERTFFISAISHVTHLLWCPNYAKLAVAWPKTVKTHNLPRLIWAPKSSRGANFFSFQPFFTLHVFYGVPATQKWPLPGQKQSKHTTCHVYFGLQKIRAARGFLISAISHVTRLLRRPNHAKMAVVWPKTVKTHKLPRLIWAAKSSKGANLFHPSHFARYISFTASQPRKKCRCLAKNSQNTHFATFNLGCKKFARREIFSSQPFPTLHVFYGVPTTQNWPLPGQKQRKHSNCHV